MNRLQTEVARLYEPASGTAEAVAAPMPLVDARGDVRALVIELARPASWEPLGRVWRGVQTELDLPAPGIAVSGTDGLQLWFSLALPLAGGRAHRFLEAIRARFLPEVAAGRVALMPRPAPQAPGGLSHARAVPACDTASGNWSAFVAADLAPVFAETPWLDLPPNEEGQATLLRALQSIKPAAFEAAWLTLGLSAAAPPPQALAEARTEPGALPPDPGGPDPRRFLQVVMSDAQAPLALRIEAAKALLQFDRT